MELLSEEETLLDINSELPQEKETLTSKEDLRNRSSTLRVTMNTINYMEGTGFLALPYAVARGGLAGALSFAFVGILMAYTSYLLIECVYEGKSTKRKRVHTSYRDIAQAAWLPAGVTGFLSFKKNTNQVVILNIPHGIARIIVITAFVISVLSTYPLPAHMLINTLQNGKLGELANASDITSRFFPFFARSVLVVSTVIAAICIPHYALLTSLSGSIVSYAVCLFFPPVLHLGLKLDQRMPRWQMFADIFCIMFAILGSSLGCFAAIETIILTMF